MQDDPEPSVVRRELATDVETPGPQIAAVVAELEGREITELATMHECIDGMLVDLFSDPPAEDAQVVVAFTYEGYRIAVEQDGFAEFVRVDR